MGMKRLYTFTILFLLETFFLFYYSIQIITIVEPTPGFRLGDIEHIVAYLVYGLLAERMLSYTRFRQHRWHLAILISIAVGGLNEFIQSFVPGRFTDLIDLSYDVIGSIIGASIGGLRREASSS
ncbi:MAG: VanZ family protein [Candidatus Aenigmatarchaeota archaeon]|nr:VanZ family protein [Nanoarchaeota archaeon]